MSFYLLLSLLLFLFLKSIALKREQRSHNLPPGPAPLPFIGNLLKLGRLPHVSLRNLAAEHGPLIHLTLGQIPTIIASSKETAFEILRTQDRIFCSRPELIASSHLSYGGLDIAFSPYNDHWKQIKRFSNAEFFGASKVESFRAIRDEEVGVLVNTIRKDWRDGKATDLSKMAVCFFNNVIYREVFGKRTSADGECGESRHQDLIRAVIDVLPGFSIGDLFPRFWWLDWLTGWRLKLVRSFREMDKLFDEEIRERQLKKSGLGRKEENFLDLLLRCQVEKHPLLGFLMSREDVKALIVDLFFTATETAAVTIEWGMSELMKNPIAMKKAQEEVRRVVGTGKLKVEEDDLQHLSYLKLVVNEILRLHPAAPLLGPHECMQDTRINGYNIAAKTRVIINASAIGRDPKSWSDPESFQPERFLNGKINYRGNHFEFIPFGSGRRICPGMAHGVVGVEIVFANLLYCFDWELPNGMQEKELDMEERYGVSISRKNPLLLMAKPAFGVSI
ncbi:cytochrome P450 71A1-like [Phalaenopsis equestris]|uniref:cytochrome P450 71A1-like n=1 Tax=Phalaenopsis equestris TaxID=78828 RepID=UPI0009E4BD3B|nr:cytochrome P450 71A1-like [Phalaenopsis equestris]